MCKLPWDPCNLPLKDFHPKSIFKCVRGGFILPKSNIFQSEVPRILSMNMTNSSAYSVWIWPIPPHTQYVNDQFCRILSILWNTVNLPPFYIPPHAQYEYDQYLRILSMYTTNSFAFSVYLGRVPRILSMRQNVIYSTLTATTLYL